MKKINFLLLGITFSFALQAQQPFVPNYDESKVPAYQLPDPLRNADGTLVSDKAGWVERRAELYTLLANEEFGNIPQWKGTLTFKEVSTRKIFDNKALRREVQLTLSDNGKSILFNLLIFQPVSSKPVPFFLGYNFDGNYTIVSDKDISLPVGWVANDKKFGIADNRAVEAARGSDVSSWPVQEIVARGYGVVTLYYGDCDPDFDDGFQNGVHALYPEPRNNQSWGSIAAWAWGLSRVIDYIQLDHAFSSSQIIVIGHSRLGKAALWAGAADEWIAMVVSNNSGCGGAALSKRAYGETVGRINRAFPHWFCDNFKRYSENEVSLPFDQHELLALIAPRPLYVASAEEDRWADPKGEFLSCVAASPVYRILGLPGLPVTEMPLLNHPVMGTIGYHIRPGGHSITLYDWMRYIDFANIHFKR